MSPAKVDNSITAGAASTDQKPFLTTIIGNELGQAIINNELDGLTKAVDKVMAKYKANFDALIAEMAVAMSDARKCDNVWTAEDPAEVDYYEPFVLVVSAALDTAREKLSNKELFPDLQNGYAWDLSFLKHNRGVQDRFGKTDSNRFVKPGDAGMLGLKALGENEHVHWGDIHLIYEAKDSKAPGINQAATHVRQIFSHQANHTLVHAFLHQCPNQVYLMRFDRGGCTVLGDSMDISEMSGQMDFAKTLVALPLLPPLYARIDETTSPDGLKFTSHNYVCDVESTLTYRECLRGHATRAYLAKVCETRQINRISEGIKYGTVDPSNSVAADDRGGGETCEGRMNEQWCSCMVKPVVEGIQSESPPSQLSSVQGKGVSEATKSSYCNPAVLQSNNRDHHEGHEFPSSGVKRRAEYVNKESAKPAKKGKKATTAEDAGEAKGSNLLNAARMMRGKEWNALFVPVDNFNEKDIDKSFIVKESYVKDFGQDREGSAIQVIREARKLVKNTMVGDGLANIDDEDPLLVSLCDYGSRNPVKGVGHGNYTRGAHNTNESVIVKDTRQGDGATIQNSEKSGQEMRDKMASGPVEKASPVNITTRLLDEAEKKEDRTLIRQVIYSVGRSLLTSTGPREMMGAIRGILYGLYNLLKLGLIHGDISSGNCFVIEEHSGAVIEKCERDEDTNEIVKVEVKRFEKSTGLLSDMDRVVPMNLANSNFIPGTQRIGTLPFMAIYICENANACHSPVHDCESVFWLIIWVITFVAHDSTKNPALEANLKENFINGLRPEDWTLAKSAKAKRDLLRLFLHGRESEFPMPFRPFLPVLKPMAELVGEYNDLSISYQADGKTFTMEEARACISRYIVVVENNPIEHVDWSFIENKPEKVTLKANNVFDV